MNDTLCLSGEHVVGSGRAHLYNAQHTPVFLCAMKSTFNVRTDTPFESSSLSPSREAIVDGRKGWYWFVRVENDTDKAWAWVFRWEGSRQWNDTLELISRQKLPKSFKTGKLQLTLMRRWTPPEILNWAKQQYWFQDFPWSPPRKDKMQKANSRLVWDEILPLCSWANRSVLDIGTHYGYHALRAAGMGASVVGFEPDDSRNNAVIIDQHIEQQGVEYVAEDPGGRFDVILYLSVHHQIDPDYNSLSEKVEALRSRCRDLFVELILPSSYAEFGAGRSDKWVDKQVQGYTVQTYPHRVRGVRRIYHVQGEEHE